MTLIMGTAYNVNKINAHVCYDDTHQILNIHPLNYPQPYGYAIIWLFLLDYQVLYSYVGGGIQAYYSMTFSIGRLV